MYLGLEILRMTRALWDMYNKSGKTHMRLGNLAEAEKMLKAALDVGQEFGSEDPRLSISLNNLARLYLGQKRYEEAENLCSRALAIAEGQRGPGHPDVAVSLNNLAAVYREQGQYDRAEPLYKEALAIWEKVGAKNPRGLATTLENYATLLRKTNRHAEADAMESRAKGLVQKPTA